MAGRHNVPANAARGQAHGTYGEAAAGSTPTPQTGTVHRNGPPPQKGATASPGSAQGTGTAPAKAAGKATVKR